MTATAYYYNVDEWDAVWNGRADCHACGASLEGKRYVTPENVQLSPVLPYGLNLWCLDCATSAGMESWRRLEGEERATYQHARQYLP